MMRVLLIAIAWLASLFVVSLIYANFEQYHVLHGFNWSSYRCYDENPFIADSPMEWDSSEGLTELQHSNDLRDPIAVVIVGDIESIRFVYKKEHYEQAYSIGVVCPTYEGNHINIHLRAPAWGNWQGYRD